MPMIVSVILLWCICERVGKGMTVCEFNLGELSKLKLSVMIYNLQDGLNLTSHISTYVHYMNFCISNLALISVLQASQ